MTTRHRKENKKSPEKVDNGGKDKCDCDDEKIKRSHIVRTSTDPSVYKKAVSRALIRVLFIAIFLIGLMFIRSKDDVKVFASQKEHYEKKVFQVSCSKDYNDFKRFPGCTPTRCGRIVIDGLISEKETQHLLKIARSGLALGGSNGGASILDLHSGALSKGNSFINVFKYLENENLDNIFDERDVAVYKSVKNKIKAVISREFNIHPNHLHLTHPTFFSRMTNKPAQTVHDEYWHPHIDKVTYETFDYTSLVYLSDYGEDFDGGRFVFVDKEANWTVEPKLGRVSFFTSGSENLHFVEKVNSGTRYAITVSFTCDDKHAIKDPQF